MECLRSRNLMVPRASHPQLAPSRNQFGIRPLGPTRKLRLASGRVPKVPLDLRGNKRRRRSLRDPFLIAGSTLCQHAQRLEFTTDHVKECGTVSAVEKICVESGSEVCARVTRRGPDFVEEDEWSHIYR